MMTKQSWHRLSPAWSFRYGKLVSLSLSIGASFVSVKVSIVCRPVFKLWILFDTVRAWHYVFIRTFASALALTADGMIHGCQMMWSDEDYVSMTTWGFSIVCICYVVTRRWRRCVTYWSEKNIPVVSLCFIVCVSARVAVCWFVVKSHISYDIPSIYLYATLLQCVTDQIISLNANQVVSLCFIVSVAVRAAVCHFFFCSEWQRPGGCWSWQLHDNPTYLATSRNFRGLA